MHQRKFHVFVILEDKALTVNWNQLSNSEPRQFFFHIPNRKYMRFSIVPKWENISSVIKKKTHSRWIRHMTNDLRVTPHSRKCPTPASDTLASAFPLHSSPAGWFQLVSSASSQRAAAPPVPTTDSTASTASMLHFLFQSISQRAQIINIYCISSSLTRIPLHQHPPFSSVARISSLSPSSSHFLPGAIILRWRKNHHTSFFGTSLPPFLSATSPPLCLFQTWCLSCLKWKKKKTFKMPSTRIFSSFFIRSPLASSKCLIHINITSTEYTNENSSVSVGLNTAV